MSAVLRECGLRWVDRHLLSPFVFGFKFDDAIDQCEKAVILGSADIRAGMKLRPPLLDQDAPSGDGFATKPLDPEVFGIAVSAVPARANTLLMSHAFTLPSRR